jgi:hypothetical protein
MKRRIVLLLLIAFPAGLLAGAWLWVKAAESRRWAHLERRVAELGREADRRRCPRPVLRGTPVPGDAWDDYLPAIDLLRNMGEGETNTLQLRSYSAGESDLPELRKVIQPYLQAVERMQQGTRRADSRRVRLDERLKPGEQIEESWLMGTLRLAYLSSSQARRLALEGKTRDAAELLMDLGKYAQDVSDDGSEMALRLGNAIWAAAMIGVHSLVDQNRLSPEDWASMERDLARLEATFSRFGPVLLTRLEYFGRWILDGSKLDTLTYVGCIPGNLAFKPGWRVAFSQPLMAVAGFDQTDAWTTRLMPWDDESIDEQTARWQNAVDESDNDTNIYFRLFTNGDGLRHPQALVDARAELRILRMAVHYKATGEPLDLKLPGFGTTIEPKAVYFWGPFVGTITIPR